jgi:NAD(P)H-hydrate epimerase
MIGSVIVTAAEMRALDTAVIDDVGVPGVALMEAAGRGVVDVLARVCDLARARVVVYAGPGNNGGDGYVVARLCANRGAAVEVLRCAAEDKLRGDARTHMLACARSGVPIHDATTVGGLAAAGPADVVVDALLGTGLARDVEGHLRAAIAHLNARPGLKVAVDVPSGLDSDRGVPLGDCVRADHTVTFAFAKRGLVGAPGFTFAGQLHVADIGIPESLARARGVAAVLLDERVLAPLRAPRDPMAHKGTAGHLLLVAGSTGKAGAALLAGGSALRTGVGLCTLAAPREIIGALDGKVAEVMTAAYDVGASLASLVAGRRAVAIGPGMPTDAAMRPVLAGLVAAAAAAGLPVVLDADALNHLAAEPHLLDGIAGARLVLTPHPGEAARLAGRPGAALQQDRVAAASALAARFSAIVALKGARTVVAAPDGRIAINPTGNPGLASGGTGDVLTGCVGALLAQGLEPFHAAAAAVYLHGAAADRVAARRGMRGLLANDVIDALPETMAG